MRQSPQPAENPEADLITTLIQCLSPERRRELVGTAAQSRFIELIDAHQGTTIADFFQAVQADPHWALLKDLLVSDVILSSGGRTSEAESGGGPDVASSPHEDASGEDRRQMHLAIVAMNNAPEAPVVAPPLVAPAAAPRSATSTRRKRSGDILEDIVELLEAEPGLRSEEIQKRLDKPPVLVKSTLVALRKHSRVRIEGTKRAARYFALAK